MREEGPSEQGQHALLGLLRPRPDREPRAGMRISGAPDVEIGGAGCPTHVFIHVQGAVVCSAPTFDWLEGCFSSTQGGGG